MSIIHEGIILNENDSLSFGNYLIEEKLKIKDFKAKEDLYKVRTHNQITRLSKNGNLLLETVPGSTIHNFVSSNNFTYFEAEGLGNTLITIELEPNATYSLHINDVNIDKIKTNIYGKINFSTTLSKEAQPIKIEKVSQKA